MPPSTIGRLAPTPSGHLHLGNALAFGAAWLSVRDEGGRLLLRVEDLDRGRAREEVAEGQRHDLRWLGIDWDEEVPPQSTRAYPLDGLPTYRCDCSRKRRREGLCTCRHDGGTAGVWRFACPPGPVTYTDEWQGEQTWDCGDDPVVRRRDGEAAYPHAVVVDDHRDGVTQVVRGADLLQATVVQIRIQQALGLSTPRYRHVPMLLGADGRKLSKSHGSDEIRALRDRGWTPDRVWAAILPCLGLPPVHLHEAVGLLAKTIVPAGPFAFDAEARPVPLPPA